MRKIEKKKDNESFVIEKSVKIETKDEIITLEEGDKIEILEQEQTPESYKIKKYEWKNGKLNVFHDVRLSNLSLKELPFEFGIVDGSFWCSYNQLTSLEGAPKEVGGDFRCNDNQLKTLKGAPQIVDGDFICYDNQLTSLKGAPKYVVGNFYCSGNKVKFTEEDVRKVCDVKRKIYV